MKEQYYRIHVALSLLVVVLISACKKDTSTGPENPETRTTFTKTFGGSSTDYGKCVRQTTDGGFIVVGWMGTYGDAYLIKTDVSGNLIWQRTFGGSGRDYGESVLQTSDSGFVVVGMTGYMIPGGGGNVYLLKTNVNGNLLWQRSIGGSDFEKGNSVQLTSDGGYILAGLTKSFGAGDADVYLIKTDVGGNVLWTKTFGGSNYDEGSSVQQTTDGGFIVAGSTNSFGAGNSDVYLIKTDATGNALWTKTFGDSSYDWGGSVQQTTDGGFIVAGSTHLIKADVNGNLVWQKTFSGGCASAQQTRDNGFIVTGETYLNAGNEDVYLFKTNASGDLLWQKAFGGNGIDFGASVQQTTDGGFIVVGSTLSFGAGESDIYLIKTDAGGVAVSPQ